MDGLRQQILTENIQKWGNANHIITRLDGTFFNKISDYFDLIVLDAPCSGEGMFRKDAYAIKDWSMDKVYQCERIQNKLIDTAFDSLKPGGYLIYSTCTFNTIENEDHFKVTNFIAPSIQIEWEGVQVSKLTNALQLRFFPHQFKGEGKPFAEHNSKSTVSSFKPIDFQSDLFQSPNDFKVISFDGMLYGVSQSMLNTIPEKLLPFIKQLGTELGQMKGKDFIPSQHLVTSEIVSPNVPRLQLDKSNLIKYLQHVPFSALNSVSPGWAVVQYEQHDFGWVKMISTTRMNNYYPKNWRIKSQYISA
jgi:NOL1/NOP2/fmu family ribosome biogenesis protein